MNWYHPDLYGRRIYPSMVRPIKPDVFRQQYKGVGSVAVMQNQRVNGVALDLIEVVW